MSAYLGIYFWETQRDSKRVELTSAHMWRGTHRLTRPCHAYEHSKHLHYSIQQIPHPCVRWILFCCIQIFQQNGFPRVCKHIITKEFSFSALYEPKALESSGLSKSLWNRRYGILEWQAGLVPWVASNNDDADKEGR